MQKYGPGCKHIFNQVNNLAYSILKQSIFIQRVVNIDLIYSMTESFYCTPRLYRSESCIRLNFLAQNFIYAIIFNLCDLKQCLDMFQYIYITIFF